MIPYAIHCPACKGVLLFRTDVYVCSSCGKGYSEEQVRNLAEYGSIEARVPMDRSTARRKIAIWIIAGVLLEILVAVCIHPIFLILTLSVHLGFFGAYLRKIRDAVKLPAKKTAPETVEDYIAVFRTIQQNAPECSYAGEAAYQLKMLRERQKVLHYLMGGTQHSFRDAENEAEVYILANCKRLYVRLQCCNLRLPSEIAAYDADFQQCLNDNAVVLRDFERLTYEVSKLDEGSAPQAPALGVLADALHEVRTGQRELPQRRIS